MKCDMHMIMVIKTVLMMFATLKRLAHKCNSGLLYYFHMSFNLNIKNLQNGHALFLFGSCHVFS